jgi:hypothetical protein
MFSPGASSTSIFEKITIEGYKGAPLLDERALFDIAFSRALQGRSFIRLALYTSDVFRACYQAEVEITADDFGRWREHGVTPSVTARVWQPPMLPLTEVKEMPEEIPLADFSSPVP